MPGLEKVLVFRLGSVENGWVCGNVANWAEGVTQWHIPESVTFLSPECDAKAPCEETHVTYCEIRQTRNRRKG